MADPNRMITKKFVETFDTYIEALNFYKGKLAEKADATSDIRYFDIRVFKKEGTPTVTFEKEVRAGDYPEPQDWDTFD